MLLLAFLYLTLCESLLLMSPSVNQSAPFIVDELSASFCALPPIYPNYLEGPLIVVDPAVGCLPIQDDLSGKFILSMRGVCSDGIRLNHVASAGAMGFITFDDGPSEFANQGILWRLTQDGVVTTLPIHCTTISRHDGLYLTSILKNSTITVRVYNGPYQTSQDKAITDLYQLAYIWDGDVWPVGSSDPCSSSWDGVRCDESGMISHLRLPFYVNGTLPSSLSLLTHLVEFRVKLDGYLLGPLPDALASWSGLKYLTLRETTKIAGISDVLFAAWKSLVAFDLSYCNLTGQLPQVYSPNLRFLNLNGNYFQGTIPSQLEALEFIEYLDLSDNELSGAIPVGSWPQLVQLDLHANYFSSFYQTSNDVFTSLDTVDLSDNEISDIPNWVLSSWQSIRSFNLGNNYISSLPNFTSSNLTILDLSYNKITGSLSSVFPYSIQKLRVAGNNISSIDFSFARYEGLELIDLTDNDLEGDATSQCWQNLPMSLKVLLIANNRLTDVGNLAHWFPYLIQIDISENLLSGLLPLPYKLPRTLEHIDFSSNNLSGEVSQGYSDLQLTSLLLHNNQLRSLPGRPVPAFINYTFSTSSTLIDRGLECPSYKSNVIAQAVITLDPEYHYFGLCRCLPNFFRSPEVNDACVPCLEFASCPGSGHILLEKRLSVQNIYALHGYFPVPSPETPKIMVPCRYTSVIPEYPDNPCNFNLSGFLQTTQFQCAPGHTGRLCSRCIDGYFWRGGRCIRCTGRVDYPVFAILLVIILASWTLVFVVRPPLEHDSPMPGEGWSFAYRPGIFWELLPLLVEFFQKSTVVISKLNQVDVVATMQAFFGMAALSSAPSSSGLGIECGPNSFHSFSTQYHWTAAFPVVFLAALALLFVAKFFVLRWWKPHTTDFSMQLYLYFYGVFSFLSVIYFPLATYVFSVFQCSYDSYTQTEYLNDRPYLPCSTIELPLKVVSLLVYGFGILFLFTGTSIYLAISSKTVRESTKFVQSFGPFYLSYKPNRVIACAIFLFRDLTLSFIVGLVPPGYDFYPILVVTILAAHGIYVIIFQPFRVKRWNHLEVVATVAVIMIFFNTLIFASSGVFSRRTPLPAVVHFVLMLGVVFYFLYHAYRENKRREIHKRSSVASPSSSSSSSSSSSAALSPAPNFALPQSDPIVGEREAELLNREEKTVELVTIGEKTDVSNL